MIALIDADVICYRAAAVSVESVDWDGEGVSPLHNLTAAKSVAARLVSSWTKAAGAKRSILVFSDRSKERATFRYDVHPEYKGTRGTEKPPLHDATAEFLRANYKSMDTRGLEGDDLLGLLATGPDAGKYVVVSVDKDLLTVPCRQVNPDDPRPKPRKVSLREADYNWMYQTITGDSVDNYKGAPGAGPKAAEKALLGAKNLEEMWARTLMVFADQQDHPKWGEKFVCQTAFDEALMNARCARILRHGDYDPKHGVRLWHPDPELSERLPTRRG